MTVISSSIYIYHTWDLKSPLVVLEVADSYPLNPIPPIQTNIKDWMVGKKNQKTSKNNIDMSRFVTVLGKLPNHSDGYPFG